MKLALFRVVQEALSNVHRHAGDATVRIMVGRDQDAVMVEIADTGRGFNPVGIGPAGVGLASMRERMRQITDTLRIESGASGTRVLARAPIAEEQTRSA